jgi:hypothetical protein
VQADPAIIADNISECWNSYEMHIKEIRDDSLPKEGSRMN